MAIEPAYSISSKASGGGRDGEVVSASGQIDLELRPPKELGGSGDGIETYLPGLEEAQAKELAEKAHAFCPYSKATKGNIDHNLTVRV